MKLAWSLIWRIALLGFIFSFLSIPLVQYILSNFDPVESIYWQSSVVPWVFAAFLWILSAVSPVFFVRLVWGQRVGLSLDVWLVITKATSLFFVVYGVINILLAKLAPVETWVNYKLFAITPLYLVFMVVLAWHISRDCALTKTSNSTRT